MSADVDQPRKSLLSRIVSLETAMALFACYSLISGLVFSEGEEAATQIFWGIMILCGLGVLVVVRRRDWKKHWEGMEADSARRAAALKPAENNPEEKSQ